MTLARKRPRPAAKGGSRLEPAAASPSAGPQEVSPSGTDASRPAKHRIWFAALVGAGIVAAVGFGFQFLNGGGSAGKAADPSIATFVGSDTCSGCHQAE